MRRWLIGLAIAFASAGLAVADEKVEAVVKKGIEAHGGADALNKYKATKFKMKGDMHVLGMDLEFTGSMAYSFPDRYRLDVDTEVMGQKLSIQQIVKGEMVRSTVKVGGMEMPAGGDPEKEELKFGAALQEALQLTTLLDKKKFTLKAADDEDVNGKKASVVVVTPAGFKKDAKLYFDKTSGLVVKTSHKGIGPGDGGAPVDVLEDSYLMEYKQIKGLQVATKMEVKHDNKKFLEFKMTDIEILEKIDDKEFAIDD
jgi:hypothetical protein